MAGEGGRLAGEDEAAPAAGMSLAMPSEVTASLGLTGNCTLSPARSVPPFAP